MENVTKKNKLDLWIPIGLYVALLMIKLIYVVNNRSLPLIADEFTYVKYARALVENGSYRGVQYPLLYPLLLSLSFVSENNFYIIMKIINALCSSFVPVIVYFICRMYVDEKKSAMCAAFSAVIPFQYITTMTIMSENLYFPLLLLAIYVTLREFKNEILGDVLLGAMLGMLFLTRHITLTLIPVFLFVWLMKQLEDKKKIINILVRGMLICGVLLVVYSPWVLMCRSYGYGYKLIIGFSIASKTNPEQLTISRLLMTAGFYMCYYVLICAPFLGMVIKSFRGLEIKQLFHKYNRLWVMCYGLIAALFVAIVRHSWRAAYNYPDFTKIKGRYVIYVPLLVLIVGTVAVYGQRAQFKKAWSNILACYAVPMVALVMSYLIDIRAVFYELPDIFIDFYESMDGRRIKIIGVSFVTVTLLVMFVYQWIHDYGKGKIKKYSFVITAISIIGLEIWGATSYYEKARRGDESNCKKNYRYAWEVKDTLKMIDSEENAVVYVGELPEDISTYVCRAMDFYGLDQYDFESEIPTQKDFYVIAPEKGTYRDSAVEVLGEYNWADEKYYFEKVVIE